MFFAEHNSETQKRNKVITFNLNTPYKPRYEQKIQLTITVIKKKKEKKKKNTTNQKI